MHPGAKDAGVTPRDAEGADRRGNYRVLDPDHVCEVNIGSVAPVASSERITAPNKKARPRWPRFCYLFQRDLLGWYTFG
jgi:hypothetical protein